MVFNTEVDGNDTLHQSPLAAEMYYLHQEDMMFPFDGI
jgi:hypothetical protein